mmetsp:Transcript_23333/g.55134  ORF Transcript_23333/g.55134 Transcript_23333/m.55134 type:complete len:431 (+) Transcript_23333:480-1772(+)
MATLNIGGSKDPAYRYKMPKLVSKIEGRGNGIKTVVVNCVDIAKSLNRLPTTVIKFLGVEMGAQSRFEADSERAIVNGAFEADELQDTLAIFIDKFVLCPVCKLPETVLSVKLSSGTIWHKCQACGAKEMVDMAHKLCKSILQDAKTEAKDKKGGKKDKKEKKAKESKEAKKAAKKAKKAAKKAMKERERGSPDGAGGKESDDGSDDDDVVWHTDLSESAVAARAEELARELSSTSRSGGAAGGAGGDGEGDDLFEGEAEEVVDSSDSAVASAADALTAFLADGGRTPDDIAAEVRELQTNSALPPSRRVSIYWRAVFGDDVATASADEAKLAELAAVMKGGAAGFQDALLEAVVDHVGERTPSLARVAPIVLKNLYDGDVLEEAAALKWAEAESPEEPLSTVLAKCAPFISWLKTAAEESSSEEESDDE